MASTGPYKWYVSSVGWSAVTAWPASTAISAGQLYRQNATPTAGQERVFICIVAGTTGATEPTWVITKGAKTTDNTVTWQEVTAQPGVNGDLVNCPTWLQNKFSSLALGQLVQDAAGDYLFMVSTAGVTGNGAEPTWNKTAGATNTDNTVTWTCLGPVGNFSLWDAPSARINNILSGGWLLTTGNYTTAAQPYIFVADNHAETWSAGITMTFATSAEALIYILCVDHTSSTPWTASAITTGATFTTTGTSSIILLGSFYIIGISFYFGTGTGTALFGNNGLNSQTCIFQNLSIVCGVTGTNSGVEMGNGVGLYRYINVVFGFASITNTLIVQATFEWLNTPSAISGSIIPTFLFSSGGRSGFVNIHGVDLSAVNTTLVNNIATANRIQFSNCLLNSSVALCATENAYFGANVDFINCDSAPTNYQASRYSFVGNLTTNTTIALLGGANISTINYGHQIVTNAFPTWLLPFQSFQIAAYNSVTAATVTCTIYGIINSATLPNNDQVWMSVEYSGSASSPMASFANNTKATVLDVGTALTQDSSSSNWKSFAPVRASSTAYTVGQYFFPAAAGHGGARSAWLWFCTTAGTTASTQPTVYSSQAQGTSVVDGTATFRAGQQFYLQVDLSSPQPQLAGYLYATVYVAIPSSTVVIDPVLYLS